jgi:hypothetical protein
MADGTMSTFNDDRSDETDDVSEMLSDLPQVDPPSSLVRTVMTTIGEHAKAPVTQPQVTYIRRGSTMAKKVLWSMAAVAAMALVALKIVGYPPVEQGTEATIGAAQRYQEAQVSAADVKVEDQQFQAFLQSDLFRQLANDKAAQSALKNQDLQKALADATVRAALARADVRTAISNNLLHLARADARHEAIAQLRLDARSQAALEAALNASPALINVIANANIADAIANSSLAQVLARSDAALAVSQQAVLNALFQASSNALADAAANASANASTNARNK